MILITGPTGSGKTTTLYSAIHTINSPDINIMTAEYPVEYNLKGVNQVQVNDEIGRTFAGLVTLKVYDVIGREVATLVNEQQKADYYKVTLDASRFASGVYFYRLQAGNFVDTKKLLLLR